MINKIINNIFKPHKIPNKIINKIKLIISINEYKIKIFEKKQNDFFKKIGLDRELGIIKLNNLKKNLGLNKKSGYVIRTRSAIFQFIN